MMRVTQDDLTWWAELAPTLPWHFASTMKDSPHSYVIRDKTLDSDSFDRAVTVIRTFGEPGMFYQRTNLYLSVNGTKWWADNHLPVAECDVINQAPTDQVYGKQSAPHTHSDYFSVYDSLATEYDQRYDADHCPECPDENEAVRRLLVRHFGAYAPRTLDVGCGTGLLLDLAVTSPALYTGVDPSQGMLNELVRKHPKVRSLVPARIEDVISKFSAQQFELVAALFGSPSYVEPETVGRLPDLSSDLTVLMNYREGYWPDYWEHKPPNIDESRDAAMALTDARHFRLNDMVVTVVGDV